MAVPAEVARFAVVVLPPALPPTVFELELNIRQRRICKMDHVIASRKTVEILQNTKVAARLERRFCGAEGFVEAFAASRARPKGSTQIHKLAVRPVRE